MAHAAPGSTPRHDGGGSWGTSHHRRTPSTDYQAYQKQQQSKEDYLDNLLSSYDHTGGHGGVHRAGWVRDPSGGAAAAAAA